MSLLVGQRIDQYEVKQFIAMGGMAEVYLAVDSSLRRDVVLKVMLPNLMQDKEFIQRFQREAQAVAKLRHGNIVQVYSTGTTNDKRLYMAMEYVSGGTLEDWIDRFSEQNQSFTVEQVLFLSQRIASALVAAHNAGIVHRDLKPSNILMMPDATPLITDLGIAATLDNIQLTATGRVFGTPHYMSPEQGKGIRVDGRSDIYTLGVILYELLAGKRPFEGTTSWAVIQQHINNPPPSLGKVRPDLPYELRRVVAKCLAKKPAKRYQSAEALLADLGKVPAFSTPTTGWQVPMILRERGGLIIGIIATLILLAGGFTWFSSNDEKETPTPTSIITDNSPTSTSTPISVVDNVSATPTPTATPTNPPRIAFQSNRDGDYEIFLMELDGSNQMQLTQNGFADQYPRVSPDGEWIAFQSSRDGNFEVYVMRIDGSEQRRLTDNSVPDKLPTWSPDGRFLAFNRDQVGEQDIYTIEVATGIERRIIDNQPRDGHVGWSVDGKIVFNAGTRTEETWEIYTTNADGTNLQQLTNNNISEWSPEWSPDGSQILYLKTTNNGDPAIYVMNANGSQPQQIFNSIAYEWGPVWSGDGQFIIFTYELQDTSAIYIMNADGTNARIITEQGSYPSWAK